MFSAQDVIRQYEALVSATNEAHSLRGQLAAAIDHIKALEAKPPCECAKAQEGSAPD